VILRAPFHAILIPPAPGILFLALSLTACSGSRAPEIRLHAYDAVTAYSHSIVEEMSDEEYISYAREALEMVAVGDAWGERILRFFDEQARYVDERQFRRIREDAPGGGFWLVPYVPEPGVFPYFFQKDPRALRLPRLPMNKVILGLILAHELQHAYDAQMWPALTEAGTSNYVMMEMNACRLAVALVDNYTRGRFMEVIREGIAEGAYDREYEVLLMPSKDLTRRLDELFDDPSPWEAILRYPLYIEGLNFAACHNQVERTYAMYALLLLDGRPLAPPGTEWGSRPVHQGIDLAFRRGESVPSPIEGRVQHQIHDEGLPDTWSGIVIEGTGDDAGRTVRIIGLSPVLPVDAPVAPGELLGTVQDPREVWKGIKPHLHVEYYVNGMRQDPAWITNRRWTDRTFGHSLAADYFLKTQDFERRISEGSEAERARRYREAINHYQEARSLRIWDHSNLILLHYIARCRACLEEYEQAAETQRILVNRMEKELVYAEGGLPHPDLGTIGAVTPPEMLRIFLEQQRRNLNAYLQGMDTLFVH